MAIFQNVFDCVMSAIAEQITAQEYFAMEFEDKGIYQHMSSKFWKGLELCSVFICRKHLPSADLAQLHSIFSTQSEVVASSECPADLVRTIGSSEFFSRGVRSCF